MDNYRILQITPSQIPIDANLINIGHYTQVNMNFGTIIHIIWFAIPLLFFTIGLWCKLEQLSGRRKSGNPMEFFKQGTFVLICVLICYAIDLYLLADLANFIDPEWIPLVFYQIGILPLVLLITAKVVGPSKEIRIEKVTKISEKRRK